MKSWSVLLAGMLLVMAGSSYGAITYDYSLDSDGVLTTPYSWAQVESFDESGSLLWNWTGNGAIVQGSVSNKYAAPYNSTLMSEADTTHYATVPSPNSDGFGTASVSFNGHTYHYFGLFWGSVDTYNTIQFLKDNDVVASFTGSDVLNPTPANGNQSSPYTNTYVNFTDLPGFDQVQFTSSDFAFEADNMAVGNPVPVPSSVLMVMTGLAGWTRYRRRVRGG